MARSATSTTRCAERRDTRTRPACSACHPPVCLPTMLHLVPCLQVGSVVLGLGTAFAIEGPVNTFLRAQKLFPGPHLYAGAGIVVCWAMAASLVPLMQKGKESARVGHMAFNALALGLFTWQIPTGWEITQKVIKFTKFP